MLLRTTRAVRIRTLGADDRDTLITESLLVTMLLRLGEYADAEKLGQGTLEKMRRILGRAHHGTLTTSGNLAASLAEQGKYAAAVEIEREVFV